MRKYVKEVECLTNRLDSPEALANGTLNQSVAWNLGADKACGTEDRLR